MEKLKKNAREYLKEFANSQSDWLKALIYEAIETNGNISNDKKDEIFRCLKDGNSIIINEPNIDDGNLDIKIHIVSLEHKDGVNALKQNQAIKFHEDVTILHGLNGAGKSGYFKILNEVVGGNQKKEILPNIYSDTSQSVDVKISLKDESGETKTIEWDGSSRSIDLFNKCKVFDSSYLNGLLAVRKADTTLIQPLGLNLFSYLVDLIDEFKQKLNDTANNKRLEKPILELKYLRDEFKSAFESHVVSKNIKKQIEDLFVFSEDNSKKLTKIQEALSNLKQVNIQDKVTLKMNDKTNIDNIKTYLEDRHKLLSDAFTNTQKVLKEFVKNKEANELAKKQFEVLSSVPSNDNSEWKEFVKSGEKYKSKVADSDKVCIYCRQSLQDENAIKLIHAYGEFLKDESEQKLNDSLKQINDLKKNIEGISMDLTIKPNVRAILKKFNNETTEKIISEESNDEGSQKTLFEIISTINKDLLLEKEKLLKKLNNKELNSKYSLPDIVDISEKLNLISMAIETEIKKLSGDNIEKVKRIAELERVLKLLQENKSISEQSERITGWFEIDLIDKNLKSKASKINTKSVTELSKQAHNDLLTKALKKAFKDEMENLGYKHLDVCIDNVKGDKGHSSTKLFLVKNNDVEAIFSEGEQKAVALALFIAEAKVQVSKNPIILDDPVNSLDHKISGKFAQRLLKLENQIILFNHNRLFLDAFETSKENHVCKTIDSDCDNSRGKHIRIYQVNSESKNTKGVLSNYKLNKAKVHLSKAKKLLQNSPFEDELKVASLIRKTVECVIDEVIFNNQIPTRYGNKNSRIAWGELKKLNNDDDIIDKLEAIHGRISGGEMHNGTENEENPIEVHEFNTMIFEIENIISLSKK